MDNKQYILVDRKKNGLEAWEKKIDVIGIAVKLIRKNCVELLLNKIILYIKLKQ